MIFLIDFWSELFEFGVTEIPNDDKSPDNHEGNTPLPDKKQLELILDKLQKYGVSEFFPHFKLQYVDNKFVYLLVWFWFQCGRKDTYGVYAEPVDPEEVLELEFSYSLKNEYSLHKIGILE